MIQGLGIEASIKPRVLKALGMTPKSPQLSPSKHDAETYGLDEAKEARLRAEIQTRLYELELDEAVKALVREEVPHTVVKTLAEVATESFADPLFTESAGAWMPVPEIEDVPYFVTMPFTASCSNQHGAKKRAPYLGEHTASFLKKGWSPRLKSAEIPTTPSKRANRASSSNDCPLLGIKVVELSEIGTVASSAACMMADMGATVLKIEAPGGDPWRQRDARFFTQLNRGKRCVSMDLSSKSGRENLHKEVAQADILLTNMSNKLLKCLGLGENYLEKHPELKKLVMVTVSPFGQKGPQDARGDLGAWWGASGFASMLSGKPPAVPKILPLEHGELSSSFHVMAGAMAGLFHLRRTGEGQRIEVNMLKCGMWAMMQTLTMLMKDERKLSLAQMSPEEFHMKYPVATANSFRTKDGMWIQMLGIDFKRHLPIALNALGCKYSTYGKVMWSIFTEVFPSLMRDPNLHPKHST